MTQRSNEVMIEREVAGYGGRRYRE
jgi:hypothetical protein